MTAYYNEIDPYCAQWLRNLIAAGHIAPGIVDERSIEDVTPEELLQYTQCHFFAGIGVWSLALRSAGWPDDRRVWTGSCPCQPFSAAGKGNGFADERHLWPSWFDLIAQCRPPVIFGEQVASKAVDAWIDLVHADLEGMGYAFGCVPFPSAGVGAPHIRDRTFWVADSDSRQCDGLSVVRGDERNGTDAGRSKGIGGAAACGEPDRLGNPAGAARERDARSVSGSQAEIGGAGRVDGHQHVGLEHAGSGVLRVANAEQHHRRCEAAPADNVAPESNRPTDWTGGRSGSPMQRPGPANGFWRAADWLGCTDGKWRPVEARVQQMVDGNPLRVGPMCPVLGEKVQEVMNEAAQRLQTETDTLLREVRDCVGSEDIFGWRGGAFGVHEAQILLAYLLQFAGEERIKPDTKNGPGTPNSAERDVRVLWRKRSLGDTPRQRGLDRWPLRELADSLRALSSAVARFASEAGYQNLYADAAASFPLGELLYPDSLGELRPKARAARLRAYGNAINVEAAAEFIRASY